MDKNKAIAYFEKVIRDTDQVLPHCSEALRAELLEQRGYYELALEALRPEERELAEVLDWFSAECMEHGGDAGGPYLTNQDGVEQAGREVAAAVTALLARAGQTDTPPWAGMIRKRFEQVR